MKRDPFAARLYFIPRAIQRPQAALVNLLREYFSQSPGWVLLTTRGRKTGLPREVLLPCGRSPDSIVVISTYGWRSHWIRNIENDPNVHVTCAGWQIPARARIVEDIEAKCAIVSATPFFPAAPFTLVNAMLRTLLKPIFVPALRHWVTPRPIAVIHLDPSGPGAR